MSQGRKARRNSNLPHSALIRPKPPSPKSPRKKRRRRPVQNGRLAAQNLPSPHSPLTTKRLSKAGFKQVFRPRTPHNLPAKSGRILPPLRFPRPPLIAMRRLQLKSRLPHPHSPQPFPDPKPQSQTSSPKAQIATQDDQRPQGTAPINAATMAVGPLTGAFRRPETRSQPPTPAAPADPRPSAPQSLLNRFAVKNILDTLRGPQDQTRAAPPASTLSPEKAGATAPTNATRAPTTNAAVSPGAGSVTS